MTSPIAGPMAAAPPTRRRRRLPWIVAFLIVVGLVVGAWFAGESIARGIVERTIREQAITQLSLPSDQQIDVDVPGPVLLPLMVGSLPEVNVASDAVPLGPLVADISVHALDVPVRGDGDWSGANAHVRIDEQHLQDLLDGVEGFPADTVVLDEPDVLVTFELDALVTTVPVGVALTPRAEQGDLVLAPTTLRLAGAEISAEAILRQFGAIASTVVRDWDVCIAQYLPAALTLTDVAVESGAVVADFDIDSAVLRDPAAQENGTCA